MRVKDIAGKNRNVKPEKIQLHYESARGLTYWHNNLRLILTTDQVKHITKLIKNVTVFDGYNTQIKPLSDITAY